MNKDTYRAIKRLAIRNDLGNLKNELEKLYNSNNLSACKKFIQNALNEIDKGKIKSTDPIQQTTTDELLEDLGEELNNDSKNPNFKFKKTKRSKNLTIQDDLGFKDESNLNIASDQTVNAKIELAKIEERVKELIKKPGQSNRDILFIANDWLPDLIKRISQIDEPTHDSVLEEIQSEFPDFNGVPDEPNLKLATGTNRINKTSIDKALTHIFNNKYEEKIERGTIKKRADEFKMWKNEK